MPRSAVQSGENFGYGRTACEPNFTMNAKSKTAARAAKVSVISLPSVVLAQPKEDFKRRALRVLAMVHELHKAGYQRLRIVPGASPSGCWRCSITPITNILRTHGAMSAEFDRDAIHYSSAQANNYFGWKGVSGCTARELGAEFIRRCPEIAAKGLGEDWEYAGWYVMMLGVAERGDFPEAYADWGGAQPEPRYLPTCPRGFHSGLPMPPGGEAEASKQ